MMALSAPLLADLRRVRMASACGGESEVQAANKERKRERGEGRGGEEEKEREREAVANLAGFVRTLLYSCLD